MYIETDDTGTPHSQFKQRSAPPPGGCSPHSYNQYPWHANMSPHETNTGGFEQFSNLIICWRCFVLISCRLSQFLCHIYFSGLRESQRQCWPFIFALKKGQMDQTVLHFLNILACFLTSHCLSHPPRTWQCKVSPISQHLCLSPYGNFLKAQTLLRTIFSDYSCSPNHGDLLCHRSPQISVACTPSCSLCQLISGREQWSCPSVPAGNITRHWPEWKQWALTEEWTDAALH